MIVRVITLTPLLFLIPLLNAAPTKRAATPITDGGQISGKTYDYVIAGGGLAGMVLAKRLTEDAGRSVLVIEAGSDQEGNTGVTDTSKYQSTFGSAIDWAYQTVPQTTANNDVQTMRSGKALGGSTTINGMAWTKPHSFQIDALETVGNTGLNWNSLQPYMKKAESFKTPSSSQYAAGVTYTSSCHGLSGPVSIQYDPNSTPNNLERNFNTTVKNLGGVYQPDLTCGNPAVLGPVANTRNGNTRVDAYRGYIYGQTIPNLTILTGSTVGKLTLTSSSPPRANGIQFRDSSGKTYIVNARLEVIMATGSIKTPVILQQSGIGPASVLSGVGVNQVVDLPVGMGLIDQTTSTTDWGFKGARGGGQPILFPRFQDLVTGNDATTLRNMLQNDLGTYAQDAVNAGAASSVSGLQTVLDIQRDWILNKGAGIGESFDYSYDTTLGYDSWYLLPFSRGSIKITSNQPFATNNIAINPRYFATPFDRLAQGATVRYTRTISSSSPLSSSITGESVPGGGVPVGGTLENWASWAQANYRSNWHPIGTCAMMSQSLGGVVDSRYKVYGVNGLRVVDGSILPFQVSSHLMSVLYGLAERAADVIKADNAGTGPAPSSSVSTTSTRPSSTSSSVAPPSNTGRAIHPKNAPSSCLDLKDGNQSNGAAVQIYECPNGPNANQKWIISSGTGKVQLAGTNFCLDAGSNPSNGNKMKIWQCYDGIAAQTWNFGSDGSLSVNNKAQCLDLTDGSTANGNIPQTWACSAGNSNQVWTV